MKAREEILGRISRAIGPPATDRYASYNAVPRGYIDDDQLTAEKRIAVFVERLHDYNAVVHHCLEHEIAATVAKVLTEREKTGLLVPSGIAPSWLPEGFTFARDEGFSYAELDVSQGVLTGCAVAIALTGTIVLHHLPHLGRRALTLIPDYHLCVVFADQVVGTVPQGIRRMAALKPPLLTTISGPSATADIEMIRVKGVHGPRTLEVILVGS